MGGGVALNRFVDLLSKPPMISIALDYQDVGDRLVTAEFCPLKATRVMPLGDDDQVGIETLQSSITSRHFQGELVPDASGSSSPMSPKIFIDLDAMPREQINLFWLTGAIYDGGLDFVARSF